MRNDTDTADHNSCNGSARHGGNAISSFSYLSGREGDAEVRAVSRKGAPGGGIGLLVVYSLKDVSILSGSHGIPELISIVLVIVLHVWKRQMLLSIAGGTVCYMLLVQLVF